MKLYLKIAYIFFACLLGTTGVAAQTKEDVRHCAAIKDDLARLACYDRTMSDLPLPKSEPVQQPVAAEAQSGAQEAAPPPVQNVQPVVSENPDSIVSSDESQTPLSAIHDADTTQPLEKSKLLPASEIDEVTTESDQIVAVVTRVTRRARGQHVVTLDNGQIWTEDFASGYFPVAVGDTVTLKKRSISGYRLVTQSGKGYSVERIR